MAGTLVPPEIEVFPNRIRWTVDDCERLLESGCLKGRYELIDGEIISKMGQKPPHSLTLLLIVDCLISIFGALRVRQQLPITLAGEDGVYSEPEPDIAVTLQPGTAYLDRHPGPIDMVLLIEVADTSIRFDIGLKAHVYARAGVEEYWVVDITNRQVQVHKGPSMSGFMEVSPRVHGDAIRIPGTLAEVVSVEMLLPPIEAPGDETNS